MSHQTGSAPLDFKTLEAAAQWYVALSQGDDAVREAHQQWLHSDPRHAQAWGRVERLQSTFGQLDPTIARPTLQGMRAKRRAVLKVLALLITAGGAASLGMRSGPWQEAMADYRTGVGERLPLSLPDGSQVLLNTATALDVQYDSAQRRLHLHSGEILVQTASDPMARPFRIQTAQGEIRALGTRFVVRSLDGDTRIGVLEHAVEVRPQQLSANAVRVEAGQQLHFTTDRIGKIEPLNKSVDAWSRNQLVVKDWRLSEFIAELSRYRQGHLSCDKRVSQLRISGAFQLDDPELVLDNLSALLPVRIRRFTRFWTRIEAA